MMKRGDELLDLIKLDNVGFNLLSLPPRSYDEFITNFGSENTKQVYTQTGDENDVQETQTDLVEFSDVWTQHPPGIHGAIGGDKFISKRKSQWKITNSKEWNRLGRFLHRAGQMMCSLIEEGRSEIQDSKLISIQKDVDFSEKTLHLRPPLFLKECSTSFVTSCRFQPNLILVIYDKTSNNDINEKRFICLWNVNQPNAPEKILTCSCQSLCCCFSQSAEFVFAGLEDGSVALWDLREPDSLHKRFSYNGVDYVFRSPTYSTAEVIGNEGHLSPVVAVLCRVDKNSISHNSSGGIIQFATLEEDAVLCVWVLTEISHPDLAGDETNLGLAPGGKVQLVRSSSIQLQNIQKLQQLLKTNPRVKDFACHVQDVNRFYVTTDTGIVVTCTVYDEKIKIYVPSEDALVTAEANSISFSGNREQKCFLVGCSDGRVRLHSVTKEKPLMTLNLQNNAVIRKVAFCENCPNIFYLLDDFGKIHLWDLCKSDCEPVSSTNASYKRVRHFDVGSDRQTHFSTYKSYIVFGCDDGTTEVHYLKEEYSRRGDKGDEMFRKYLQLL